MDAKQSGGKGIIYILTNDAMSGYIKIGKTRNIEERVRSLDTTSVPLPFSCFFAAEVESVDAVERKLHNAFGDHRVRSNREFFKLTPERAVSALTIGPYKDVTPGRDFVETAEDQQALDQARERRPVFRFSLVDIPVGAVLSFTRNPDVTCTVVDDRKVNFGGEVISLSVAADRALRNIGVVWKAVQGPLYWEYKDKTLDEWRTKLLEEDDEPTESEIDAAGDAYMQNQLDQERGK